MSTRLLDNYFLCAVRTLMNRLHYLGLLERRSDCVDVRHFHKQEAGALICGFCQGIGRIRLHSRVSLIHHLHRIVLESHEANVVAFGYFDRLAESETFGPELETWLDTLNV